MLNEFINWVISEIQTNLSVECYSPQLPIESGKATAVTILAGDTTDGLCGVEKYSTVTFRIITRGVNDTESLTLAEDVKTLFNNTKDVSLPSYTIINIQADTPVFVDVDDINQVYYNVQFNMNLG